MGFKVIGQDKPEERKVLDRDGWRIREGARVRRFNKAGLELGEQWMVTGFNFSDAKYPDGIVKLEGLGSGNQGVSIGPRLEVMRTEVGEKAPMKVQRFHARKRDGILMEAAEARKKMAAATKRKAKKQARTTRRKGA